MKKILLTGSSGFIGSNLLINLSKSFKVYITSRKKIKNLNNIKINQIYFNSFNELNSKLKKIKIDTVIHCATHYVKNHDYSDLSKLCDSNILFGNIILENLKNMKVKQFINFSTVWENYDGKKDNIYNLYSAYKKSFSIILGYYEKKFKKIKFYSLQISDTYGKLDKRQKIINLMRNNFKNNEMITINSNNLHLNLLNVDDISIAVKIILSQKIKPGIYTLKNNIHFKIGDLIKKINLSSKKKIRYKFLSEKKIYEKIFKFKKLPNWKPKNSSFNDLINFIKV